MLGEMLRSRWRVQEYLLFVMLVTLAEVTIDLSGGHLPWWGRLTLGLVACFVIDVAEILGRRRERVELVFKATRLP